MADTTVAPRAGKARPELEAGQNDPVTYCFVVTNTGDVALGGIVVIDVFVDGDPVALAAESDPLVPGDNAYFYLETTPPDDAADGEIDDTYFNAASVTAYAVDGAGARIADLDPVGASAEAVVYPAEVIQPLTPGLTLLSSVYAGADGGASCPATKAATTTEASPLTYCFTVTNTGNTHLEAITPAGLTVGGVTVETAAGSLPDSAGSLAPGQSADFYLEAVAPAQAAELSAVMVVTANAVDETGADLVGLGEVTASDTATVTSTGPTPADPTGAASEPPPALAADAGAVADHASSVGSATGSADSATGTASMSSTEAPTALAHTGWESWLIGFGGLALAALGWLLLDPGRGLRTATVLHNKPVPLAPGHRSADAGASYGADRQRDANSANRSMSAT